MATFSEWLFVLAIELFTCFYLIFFVIIHWFFTFIREEIRELEIKVQRERERYKLSTQTLSGGFSAIPMMPINSAVRIIYYHISFETRFKTLFKKYYLRNWKNNLLYFFLFISVELIKRRRFIFTDNWNSSTNWICVATK